MGGWPVSRGDLIGFLTGLGFDPGFDPFLDDRLIGDSRFLEGFDPNKRTDRPNPQLVVWLLDLDLTPWLAGNLLFFRLRARMHPVPSLEGLGLARHF